MKKMKEMEKKNGGVPRLRFGEFDAPWGVLKIGTFVEERSTIADESFPLFSLTIDHGIVAKSKRYERSFLVKGKDEAYKVVRPGDFAFNPMNLRFGAIAKYKGDYNVAVSKYYNIFFCHENCDSQYLEYFLRSSKMIQFYNKMSTGTLEEKKRVHYLDFIHFKKPFPPLPEQQKIAAFLSAIDEKIQQLTSKKALLEQYKKGVMQQIFSGALRFKGDDEKDFPEWEEKRLGEVAEINPKSSILPESFIYIDLESVEKGQLIKETRINKTEAPSRAQRKLLPNDILYQTVRPYQMNNFLFDKEGDYVASTGYAQLRTKHSSLFLFQLLHTEYFVNDVILRCTGTSYPSINSTDLSEIKILMPNLEEQQKIANFLSSIDAKIENVTKQISQTQAFKKGLLQQMFV